MKGPKYYVTVKAINGAGLESEPMTSNGIVVGKTEFVFGKNDSGLFFFDTVNVNLNGMKEKDSGIGNTFGTLEVPVGAVEDEVKFQVYSLGEKEMKNGTDDNTTVVDPEIVKPPKVGKYKMNINKVKSSGLFTVDLKWYCWYSCYKLSGRRAFARKTSKFSLYIFR